MNQASSAVPITQELTVPAASGDGRSGATSPLSRTLGSLRSLVGTRHFRTIAELWLLEVVLFSFALLRRMGYQ